MRRALFLSAFVSSLLLLPSGAAMHCNGEVTRISAGPETIYIDDRSAQGAPRPYIYLETNDVEGLQSGYNGSPFCEETASPCTELQLLWRLAFGEPCEHYGYPDVRLA